MKDIDFDEAQAEIGIFIGEESARGTGPIDGREAVILGKVKAVVREY